ncbi:MAG: hypothetical protein KIT11_06765 [Fimbriimonadaceae bacterium]|nr:hypothetical protein [Fimbriimonadaceae bacterium]QYK56055.1 MAG: hypothetical protein KF733_00955 [Fimbriimonadaceae bacterium]
MRPVNGLRNLGPLLTGAWRQPMNRTARISFLAVGALASLGIAALFSLPAVAQVGGTLPAYVALQAQSPGTPQVGNSNVGGTAAAENVVARAGVSTPTLTIGSAQPGYPIQFPSTLGSKVSLYGESGAHYGMGVQGFLYQIYTDSPAASIAFGHGSSEFFTEVARFTGNGRLGIGTTSPGVELDVNGRIRMRTNAISNGVMIGDNNGFASWNLVGANSLQFDPGSLARVTNNSFGIGSFGLAGAATKGIELFRTGSNAPMIKLNPNPGNSGEVTLYGNNDSINIQMNGLGVDARRGILSAFDETSLPRASIYVDSNRQGRIQAELKNFRVPDPTDPRKDIVYACIEGPEAAMYTRGTGQLASGAARVSLPDHFLKLANLGTMTVHLTPRGDCEGLYYQRDGDAVIVREMRKGTSSVEFDWEVKAVRRGYEDEKVYENWDDNPALPRGSRENQWKARLQALAEAKARLTTPSRP